MKKINVFKTSELIEQLLTYKQCFMLRKNVIPIPFTLSACD